MSEASRMGGKVRIVGNEILLARSSRLASAHLTNAGTGVGLPGCQEVGASGAGSVPRSTGIIIPCSAILPLLGEEQRHFPLLLCLLVRHII